MISFYKVASVRRERKHAMLLMVLVSCLSVSLSQSALSWPPKPKALSIYRNRSRKWRNKVTKDEFVLDRNLNKILVSSFRGGDVEDVVSKLFVDSKEKAIDIVQSVRLFKLFSCSVAGLNVTKISHESQAVLLCRGGGQKRPPSSMVKSNNKSDASNFGHSFDRYGRFTSLAMVWMTSMQALTAILNHDRFFDEVTSKLMSEESSRAIKNIQSIIKRFPDHGVIDVFQLYTAKDVVLSAIALSRLQLASIKLDYKEGDDNTWVSPIDQETLRDLVRYAVFANAAYGWKGGLALSGRLHLGDLKTVLARTGVKEDQVIEANWRSRTHRPAYFIVREDSRKHIVLCIRGTLSTRDVLTDLCCTSESFNPITRKEHKVPIASAHNGMYEAAMSVSRHTRSTIESLMLQYPEYSLVIVGHSLGGGTAAVLGTIWLELFPNLKVYCYGCPCVGPPNTLPTTNKSIISVIGEGDPFATLSLGHIADTSKAISILCESPDLRKEILNRTKGNMTEDDLVWCETILDGLRKKLTAEKFYPPGRVLYMSGSSFGDDGKVNLSDIERNVFSDLVLSPYMFNLSQHIPNRYESALARYWKDNLEESTNSS